ncbi:MAG: arsenate reductase ArsC [Phenylobacterium sp.]
MTEHILRVLFLSRRNTARSLMAEAIMNQNGRGRFIAESAGVETPDPAQKGLDPVTQEVLESAGFSLEGLRTKTLRDLLAAEPDHFDFIFTLSDTARNEPSPDWPGHPISAHWSCEDPVTAEYENLGANVIYGRILAGLERRISAFMQLPFASLDRASLQHHVDQITGEHP